MKTESESYYEHCYRDVIYSLAVLQYYLVRRFVNVQFEKNETFGYNRFRVNITQAPLLHY